MTYTDPGDSRLGDGGPVDNPPRARSTDPQTSHDAAASMVETAAKQRERILTAFRLNPGKAFTADALDAYLAELYEGQWPRTTAGRRLPELLERGLVRRLDETRPTRSGRNANLWEVV